MRAIELHLDRSHGLGSPAVPGRVYLFEKPDGRTRPSIHHPPHPSLPLPTLAVPKGAVTCVSPDLRVLRLHILLCLQ